MGNKIKILVCGKGNKPHILFAQGRQFNMNRWDIDAFSGVNDPVILHETDQMVIYFVRHFQGNISVINENERTNRHITDKMRIGYTNHIIFRNPVSLSFDADKIPINNGQRRFGITGSDFRTLGV